MSKAKNTAAIKSRVTNILRKEFYKKVLTEYKPDQKLKLFDEIFKVVRGAHNELNNLKAKTKYKRDVQALRAKRGYKAKRKTSKEEYEKQLVVAK